MGDLTSITALITAAGSVIGLANKSNSVEANQKLLELQQRLADVQQTFAELFLENQNLKEENRKLTDEINAETMYPFRESARWKKSVDGTEDDGPFCPVCFAEKKMLMPLRYRARGNDPSLRSFMCPELHGALHPGRAMVYLIKESSLKKGRYTFLD
jgi:hypothetical protein